MIQIRNLLVVSLIIAITILSHSLVLAQMTTTEKMTTLLDDMWSYYDVFSKLQNDTEREDLAKQMESTAGKILEYYKNYQNPDTNQNKLTAHAFLLLAMVEYQMDNPTWTYHALQTVKGTNWGVVVDIDPITNRSFKERIDGIDSVWLPKFKQCTAQVYGFPENMIWGKLEVKIWPPLYLDIKDRIEENFEAIKGAQYYLNSEIRDGSKEITLLLPPGRYQVESDSFAIYPTIFEVKKGPDTTVAYTGATRRTTVVQNPPPTVFDITPDEYFNLAVFYCKYNQKVDTAIHQAKIDTNFVEGKRYRKYLLATVDTTYDTVVVRSVEVQKLPIAPKDLSIWKGNKQILNFNHLAYGVYEFRGTEKIGITDEYKFKRFLPEGIKWDMPRNEKFKAEDIYVKSGETYDYCVDLSKPKLKRWEPHPRPTQAWSGESSEKCTTVWDAVISSVVIGGVFAAYLHTINK